MDLIRWQVGSRLVPGEVAFDWIEGTKLIVTNGEAGLTGNIYAGLHEFEDMCFLLHFLRPEDHFFDIGANRGSYSVLASGVCGATTLAFEPIPGTYAKLRGNLRINDLDELALAQNLGLGEQAGNLWFSKSLDAANHVVDSESSVAKVSVQVVRLDEAADVVPTLIKIDVEGYEMSVFSGASDVLSNDKLKALIVEVNDSGAKYGCFASDLLNVLEGYGFKPYCYNPKNRTLENSAAGSDSSGNTIFIRDFPFVQDRVNAAKKFAIRSIEI